MTRIREIRVQPFDTTQGIGEDVRMEISASLADDLACAVREDHYCDDAGCDIREALDAGYPLVAAGLLIGATECAHVDAVLCAHKFNGSRAALKVSDIGASDEWPGWLAHHERYGIECGSCGAFMYGDDHWTPETCANCLADL